MRFWNEFHGPNAGYILELYEQYLRDPTSVDPATRAVFENNPPPVEQIVPTTDAAAPSVEIEKIVGAVNYAQALREYGHLAANLDPLGLLPAGHPALEPRAHGLDDDDLRRLPASIVGGPLSQGAPNALVATERLCEVYSGSIGYDYDHIRDADERDWLRHAAETRRFAPPAQPVDEIALLRRLTEVEVFERFLHRIFPGKHRFSVEGLDMLVPMLDEIIHLSAVLGEKHVLIGMAHRGRLNVLAHVLGKPYANILAEFKDPVVSRALKDDLGWTGDVKYHLGGQLALQNGAPTPMLVSLAPNPSHLEAVNPVVEGMARAAGTRVGGRGAPQFDPQATQPILIHGDAAFPGQGIVAETLNLSRLPGYWTGGTVHIITNNQLGFTTDPADARSTRYASDLAKGFKMPVVHVNADDAEACMIVARLATHYVSRFQKDFVIDLIGYRRWGHNEGDEPDFTQPKLYQVVRQHPTVRQIWGETLAERGIIPPDQPDKLVDAQFNHLQTIFQGLDPERDLVDYRPTPPQPGSARRVKTAVPAERLDALFRALRQFPPGFTVNPKLAKIIKKRQDDWGDLYARVIDWQTAEELAFASILSEGIAIRLTGQDAERGTFSHRHAVYHDYQTGETFTPLQALPQATAAFEIHNSPLSEAAALGFEYGYNVEAPERLVLWEAQYGDFVNGAQTILDEYIVSARAKFGQTPSLVLLLPHGYEGAGPDHSSGRLERFLNSAADVNLRIANPTTAAQYFHLLRRQALLLETDPLPLIVMTPKSLLRSQLMLSSLDELANGAWQPVIDDDTADPKQVRRVILCSGKVYADLIASPLRMTEAVIVRVEQLYRFPAEEITALLEKYDRVEQVVWAQEEPENMGAWEFARPLLLDVINGRAPLHYVGRPRSASPAEGSMARHQMTQAALVEAAFAPLPTAVGIATA